MSPGHLQIPNRLGSLVIFFIVLLGIRLAHNSYKQLSARRCSVVHRGEFGSWLPRVLWATGGVGPGGSRHSSTMLRPSKTPVGSLATGKRAPLHAVLLGSVQDSWFQTGLKISIQHYSQRLVPDGFLEATRIPAAFKLLLTFGLALAGASGHGGHFPSSVTPACTAAINLITTVPVSLCQEKNPPCDFIAVRCVPSWIKATLTCKASSGHCTCLQNCAEDYLCWEWQLIHQRK